MKLNVAFSSRSLPEGGKIFRDFFMSFLMLLWKRLHFDRRQSTTQIWGTFLRCHLRRRSLPLRIFTSLPNRPNRSQRLRVLVSISIRKSFYFLGRGRENVNNLTLLSARHFHRWNLETRSNPEIFNSNDFIAIRTIFLDIPRVDGDFIWNPNNKWSELQLSVEFILRFSSSFCSARASIKVVKPKAINFVRGKQQKRVRL